MATKPFSMKEVYDGVFEETDDKLTISNRDFGDKNLSQIIEKCVENEPALKDIVFIGCSFNKVIFDGSTIDRKLLFKECSFYGEVLFQNCNFQRELGFIKSIFYKKTIFDNCCYDDCLIRFNQIQTRPSCDYFAILNTQHKQKFDTPNYALIEIVGAVFQSVVAFNELDGLNFWFDNTSFGNDFYFTNTNFGRKTTFGRMYFPKVGEKFTKMELKCCFQTLLASLSNQSALQCEAKKIEKYIEALDGNEEVILKDTYTEQEMCDYVVIGRASFQRLKTDVKNGKVSIKLPEPCKEKPLLFKRTEVEAFKDAWEKLRMERIRKKAS